MRSWWERFTATSPWLKQLPGSNWVGPAALAVLLLGAITVRGSTALDVEGRIRDHTETWLGTPYEWGGSSLEGVDCSAFTQVAFREQFGYELPRRTNEQEEMGLEVHRDSLTSGDLVFFRTGGFIGLFKKRHVGIYLSDGEFAHASSSKGVMISNLEEPFWKKEYKTARRVMDNRGRPVLAEVDEG